MTTLPVPRGYLAVESDTRESGAGRVRAFAAVMSSGRALRSDHDDAFDMNASGVPTDSAAVVSVGACMGAEMRGVFAHVGRLAAPVRG
ncbi:hypothetical protein NK8_23650 [Caballeronia sp. NK8]|uniref:hypothetical protein n=1 Tax=Caballeronia sp. NK8 TaxID=140098 RepID=UPI001BB7D846|nr:hypothetical protein [Caballeronia sp. NK8]BCQ24212.1 hypothetical protein NK8_23650 [Caballeronia sp. NK8]